MTQAQQEEGKVFEILPDGKLVVVEEATKNDVTALVEVDRETILTEYAPFAKTIIEMVGKAKSVTVTDESQTEAMAEARKIRLALKEARCDAEKKRKEMKESSLRKGQAIDGVYRLIEKECKASEEAMQKAEDFAKIKEQERKDYLKAERRAMIESYVLVPSLFNFDALAEISETAFFDLLERTQNEYAEHKAKAEREEEARKKAEEEKAKENQRLREENEALRQENAKKAQEAANLRAEEEKKRKAEAEAKEKAEADAKKLKTEKFAEFLKDRGITKPELEDGTYRMFPQEDGTVRIYKLSSVYKP